jgi:hypothetical protein
MRVNQTINNNWLGASGRERTKKSRQRSQLISQQRKTAEWQKASI